MNCSRNVGLKQTNGPIVREQTPEGPTISDVLDWLKDGSAGRQLRDVVLGVTDTSFLVFGDKATVVFPCSATEVFEDDHDEEQRDDGSCVLTYGEK